MMQILKDAFLRYDVEFIGNKVYIYTEQPGYRPQNLQQMFAAATELTQYFERLMASWSYVPDAAGNIALLQEHFVSGAYIKIGSKRLNVGVIVLSLIGSIVLFAIIFPPFVIVPFALIILFAMIWGKRS